jgi:hypothetical protein
MLKNKIPLLNISFVVFAQVLITQTYCLKYDVTNNGNTVDVKISMTANGQAFNLGSSNVQFQYNTEVLTKPVLLQSSLLNHPAYEGTTLTQPHLP